MRGFIRMFRLSELGRRLSPLSEASGVIYWELLDSADWRMGSVLITHEELSRKINKSVRTVERAAKELSGAGLIRHKKGMFAINPEYAWGGRSWNIPKAAYYAMSRKTAQIIDFAEMTQAINEETSEKLGRKSLAEIAARKRGGR